MFKHSLGGNLENVEHVKSFRVDFYLKTTTAFSKLFSIFWEIYISSKNMLRTLTSGSYEDYFVILIVRYSIKIQNMVYFLRTLLYNIGWCEGMHRCNSGFVPVH